MFTYLKVENFRSLKSFEADFRDRSGAPKNLVLIYGENGSGKTNLVEAFNVLKSLNRSMNLQKLLIEILSQNATSSDDQKMDSDSLVKMITSKFDMRQILSDSRTCGSDGDIILEFGFSIDGDKGVYRIVYGDELKEESLYFLLNEKSGFNFKIASPKKYQISSIAFPSQEYQKSLKINIEKYWGTNTLLSIIYNDLYDSNSTYMRESLSASFFRVVQFFKTFALSLKRDGKRDEINGMDILASLDSGEIAKSELSFLEKKQQILQATFTALFSDIKDVYYKTTENDKGVLHYDLFFKKMIGGELLDISFKDESLGTKNLLKIFPYFFPAIMGQTAIIDEADTGIHDLLFAQLIEGITPNIDGQLIMTTHNTSIMQRVDRSAIHFIESDPIGNKKFVNLTSFPTRTMANHNVQDRYLQGIYGGVPIPGYLDYDEMKELLEESL